MLGLAKGRIFLYDTISAPSSFSLQMVLKLTWLTKHYGLNGADGNLREQHAPTYGRGHTSLLCRGFVGAGRGPEGDNMMHGEREVALTMNLCEARHLEVVEQEWL